MNSVERHEARYQRRKARREAKAQAAGGKTFEEVFSFGNLCKAGKKCCDGVRWKTSTINFENNLLSECNKIQKDLFNHTRNFKGFHSFVTIEHGKARQIDALPIAERTAQKCLCSNLLTKAYSRSFIYDNAASLENKGMDFAIKRLRGHLQHHFRVYGTEGGIYQFDFKGYFRSLPHDEIKKRARQKIKDDRIYELLCEYIDDFKLMQGFDADSDCMRGVGLGSEISQIIALDYANPIDHYIKDVRRIKGYGRYMDDGYIISHDLNELEDIKKSLYRIADELGIQMSDKKNVITPFKHHSFTFLKMRFSLNDNGKVTNKLGRVSIRSIRRKLDIFRTWVDTGRMLPEDAFQFYQSWRAHARRCNSYHTLRAMDARFAKLFAYELSQRKKKFPCTLKAIKTINGWKYRQRLTREKEKKQNGIYSTSSL